MEKIPVFAPAIGVNTLKHITDAFDIGWLGMGSLTKEFEEEISSYLELDNRYVVATNTGTSALHLGLVNAGVGKGDEVITPSFNWVADQQAIHMTGADVVMCDIRDDNLGIDCEKAEELITEKTKAILPLHFSGIPCNQKDVYRLAKKYNLRVIEDCTHAFGSTIDDKKIGSYGDTACFSFDPVKLITSIDGGCIVVNTKEELDRLHRLRFVGIDKDVTERYKNKRSWDYDVVSEGYRYHLTNILASVGISQIKQIDEFIKTRRKVCQSYNKAFGNITGLKIPQTDYSNIAPWIYSLRVLDGKRELLISHLRNLDIDIGIHFPPVHKHTFFKNCKCGNLIVTEKVVNEVITVPLHSNMKPEYVERIIDGITSFYK